MVVTAPTYVVKDEQGQEKKYHWNHLLFIVSLGTDSNVKPLAEPLAAGSSDDCTNVTDPEPKDIAPAGDSNESGFNQTPVVKSIMAAIHSHDRKGNQHPFESTYWGAFQGRWTSNMRPERHKTSTTSTTYEEMSSIDSGVVMISLVLPTSTHDYCNRG